MKYTVAEYLAFEERSETKHEYYAGDIYAMAGASPAHNQLCFNLGGLLFASISNCLRCRNIYWFGRIVRKLNNTVGSQMIRGAICVLPEWNKHSRLRL